jgi:MFS family permease
MTASSVAAERPLHSAAAPVIIAIGCLIAILATGPRTTMGFFLTPMTTEFGWSREVFALAIAIQNLAWGIGQPFVGMLADRFGTARVLTIGTLLYSLGLVLMAHTSDPVMLQLTAGVVIGLGIAGSAFLLVIAAFSRLLPEKQRPLAYGLGTAAASVGQFIFAPLGQAFIHTWGWQTTLIIMAAMILVVPALAWFVRGKPQAAPVAPGHADQSILGALREAFGHRSYRLLVAGFFVCGFQVAFIIVHLPPYLADLGLAAWGGLALALIGLFNIIGSIGTGILSGRMPRRVILAVLYLARSAVIAGFILVPASPLSVIVFSVLMGVLWLSTVPPTQQLIIVMFGPRYVATLFGFVFLSHQVGSFLGVWLGGVLYDRTGSYDVVWWLSIALGVFAAIVHMPIVERQVPRGTVAVPAAY